MAIAKKCDICGKMYDSYNMRADKKNTNGIMFLNIDNCQKYYTGDVMDCCPNCMAAIRLNIDILKNGGEIKKLGEVTYVDIYEDFKSRYSTHVSNVEDWRPYAPPYTKTCIPMNIVLWMNDGQTKRYSYESKRLYTEGDV